MNIYLIKRPDGAAGYDEVAEVVVVAATSRAARVLFAYDQGAAKGPADEGTAVWLDVEKSTCTKLGTADQATARVVVRHFCGG